MANMAKRDTIIINRYPKGRAGKHSSVTVESEPLTINLDAADLGKGPAEAIKGKVQREIRGITAHAASSTIAKRRREGRSGSRLFNDTGKLAAGLEVRQTGDLYETVAPRDRLGDPELIARLAEEADIGASDLVKDRKVRDAIKDSAEGMVKKGRG